jgi:hypothetical protein
MSRKYDSAQSKICFRTRTTGNSHDTPIEFPVFVFPKLAKLTTHSARKFAPARFVREMNACRPLLHNAASDGRSPHGLSGLAGQRMQGQDFFFVVAAPRIEEVQAVTWSQLRLRLATSL